MREPSPLWLRLLPAALVLLLLAEAAGGSLAIVRLRENGARMASDTIKLQRKIADATRQLQDTSARVAFEQNPDLLKARVAGRLGPIPDKNILWVRPGISARTDAAAALPTLNSQFAAMEPAAGGARTR
jgi:hypothetical protein